MPLSDGGKEKVKLRATFINNLAVGFFLVGFLGPTMDAMGLGNAGLESKPASIFCIVFSIVLHLMATRHLSEIDDDGQ